MRASFLPAAWVLLAASLANSLPSPIVADSSSDVLLSSASDGASYDARLSGAQLAEALLSSSITAGNDEDDADNAGLYSQPSPLSFSVDTPTELSERAGSGPVTWDQDTLYIAGRPFFLWSGEFHQWRLYGGPGLWKDALQKLKAGGYNTISIYTHWALTMPANDPASVDLTGINDVGKLLDIARDVGLFVIVRPGPYINAETYNGGMAAWVSEIDAQLRTNQTAYREGYEPYLAAVAEAVAPRQVKLDANGNLDVSGGSVIAYQIENEFPYSAVYNEHFEELIRFARSKGITVPTTFNEAGGKGQYSNSTVDLWGYDSYPLGFDCSNPTVWQPTPSYNTSLYGYGVKSPGFIPEFQGGSFDPFGGPGYEKCYQLVNEKFARVFDKDIMAQDVKMLSHYMAYGGTNAGWLAYGGVVYTSYDYGAGLTETRTKRNKLDEYRLIAGFLQGFPEFAKSKRQASGKNLGVKNQNNDVMVYRSLSKQEGAATSWYFVRNADSTSTATTQFQLQIDTAEGPLTIPRNGKMTIAGRDFIIVPVDKALPASGTTLRYSTSDVNDVLRIDDQDVLLLTGEVNTQYELAIAPGSNGGATPTAATVTVNSADASITTATADQNNFIVSWKILKEGGVAPFVVNVGDRRVLCIFADRIGSYRSQTVFTGDRASLDYFLNQGDSRVLVQGTYHVASGSIDAGRLSLNGQANETSPIEVFAPATVTSVSFNGEDIPVTRTNYGSLRGSVAGPTQAALSYQPPKLTGWRYADSLPEVKPGYELPAGQWLDANHNSTFNPYFANVSTGGVVLFSSAYGFDAGHTLWRGSFSLDPSQRGASKAPTSLKLRVEGGKYFAASVSLNGNHLGSIRGDKNNYDGNATFAIQNKQLNQKGENIILVLHDNTGNNESEYLAPIGPGSGDLPQESPKRPRGITGFSLDGSDKPVGVTWKVAGQYKGQRNPDKVRKAFNEGGLFGERQGWHLPGFDDSEWEERDLSQGMSGPGVGFFRTTVKLDVPAGHDVPLSFRFAKDEGKDYRALLFVNGWQFGIRLAAFGPQVDFPVPPGVLDPRGENTVAVALWALDGAAAISKLDIAVVSRARGDVEYTLDNPSYQQLRA